MDPELRSGPPIKKRWDPCRVCGEPDGPIVGTCRTPTRVSLARFGLGGKACFTCYAKLLGRERYRESKESRRVDRAESDHLDAKGAIR